MSAFDYPTSLDGMFFDNVKRYIEYTKPTGDQVFDAYVKGFYQNPQTRLKTLQRLEKDFLLKLNLLKDFDRSYYEYELKTRENNWFYQTDAERALNGSIMNFLSENSYKPTRMQKIKYLEERIKEVRAEISAIKQIETSPEKQEHIRKLNLADNIWKYSINRRFSIFISHHRNNAFVEKHNLKPETFCRDFFDKHSEEILALRDDKTKEL